MAWPLQEIFHPIIVDSSACRASRRDALMETAGKSPPPSTAKLEQWEVAPALAIAIGFAGALEESDARARGHGPPVQRVPAAPRRRLRLDPLNIVGSLPAEDQFQFEEKGSPTAASR